VFDSDGRSLSIPWTDFGVGVRMAPIENSDAATTTDLPANQSSAAGALNRIQSRYAENGNLSAPEDNVSILELPSLSESNQLFRSGRSSGSLATIELEEIYQAWLNRWWPDTISEQVCIYTHDELVQKRIRKLTTDDTSIQFRSGGWDNSKSSRMFAFVISEDDRHLQTYSRSGRKIPAEELANWINHSSRTTASHVTAHPTNDQQNVLLVDIAGPDSGRTHEILCDALAVVGLVLTLVANPKNQFPA
jgi:phage gp46-like protein